MDHELPSIGTRRAIMFALPLFALVCIVGLTMSADAALIDFENGSARYPWQYQEYGEAYDVTEPELGLRLEIRKDGGGDADFLKLLFLTANDMVMVSVNQSEPTTTCEYWVTNPNRFPIYYYYYTGPPDNPMFSFQFAAVVPGTYFIHTGQGFGDTFINMTITRINISPPPADKDVNNAPGQMVLLTDGVTHRENAGLPWDASDFFYIDIQPTNQVSKYLSIAIETSAANSIQWELYDTVGITRPSPVYTSDTLRFGSKEMRHMRITIPGNHIFRVWMMEGYGQYNLTVSVLSYPNDEDNSIEEATLVTDNSVKTGDVNLSFDRDDYYEIYLEEGQPLWVTLTPVNGPVDLYIFDVDENQKKASRKSGLVVDHIDGWEPDEAGFYYIVVESVYESPDWEDPPTVDYTLEVWINYAPHAKGSGWTKEKPYPIDEDTIDTEFDVTGVFDDKDGDVLEYGLDMTSFNSSLIDIQLTGGNKLRIEPPKDLSGYKVSCVINATDPRGAMVDYTFWIIIKPVNDAPYVDEEQIPDEIAMGEDLVKSGVNVTKPFMDVDDDYTTWTFTTTTTDTIMVELDEVTWLATFTPLRDNWNGVKTFTVTCTDKGGLTAEVTYTINMYEINDAPNIKKYLQPIDMDEETTFTIDLFEDEENAYFEDIEGKPMTYDFADNESLTAKIEGSVITLTGQKDFVGTVTSLKIWAIDELGRKSENLTVFIQVHNLPDAPEVKALIDTATVEEDEGVTFRRDVYYSFFDRDSQDHELEWNWYVDGELVPPLQIADKYNFEYIPPVTAEKDRTVKVTLEVIDGTMVASANWTVMVTNLNMPPEVPTVETADNKSEYKQGETITFTAATTDLDGDDITYEWYLDVQEKVGTGPTLELKDVDSGRHKITVLAKDTSGAETTQDFEFNVIKKDGDDDDTPGFGMAYAALALIGAIAIIAITRRR